MHTQPCSCQGKKLKLSDLANLVVNKRTNQYSLNLKKKQLFKFGLNPKTMLGLGLTIKKEEKVKWAK